MTGLRGGGMVRGVDVGRLIVLAVMMVIPPTWSIAQTPPAPAAQAGVAQPAQPAPAAGTREALIVAEQAAKVPTLKPYTPGTAERIFERADAIIEGGTLKWHPFF